MSDFGAPQSRNEAILQNMLGADNELLPPESRIEVLLQALLEQGGMSAKKFELIEQIEVTETNVNTIERSDYDYTKVLIRARIAAGSTGNVQTIIGGYNCGWWSENANGGVADTLAQIINGMFFAEYGSQMTQTEGANTTLVRRETSWGQLTDTNIDTIKIICQNSFPIGTVFEIYAV